MQAKNIDAEIQGSFLTIRIDLTKSFGETKSGKYVLIATTDGIKPVGDGRTEKMTITVYRPKP
ncbi:hypothetical protein Desaci_2011 [Desulfosporosinus acidiphilus SJ4]|uniref:Uncharacterized protein n=1 Tax=Desulfosporosinus acidiphilus (strain DSM 22704 / JCM 16185 / SJ4) TaxID=646529 RepID=I4D5B2_DESAJ|nr:hypothetical protein [Desulfosporosinus acidiphilus]AFM40986.1 hypothetical protein Desaci_2011 [Desulfosporosinus acidiphilus SJ4]